jgi:hypothetical protein
MGGFYLDTLDIFIPSYLIALGDTSHIKTAFQLAHTEDELVQTVIDQVVEQPNDRARP